MMLKKISLPLVCAVMLLTCSGCHSFKNNHRTVLDITNYFIDRYVPSLPTYNKKDSKKYFLKTYSIYNTEQENMHRSFCIAQAFYTHPYHHPNGTKTTLYFHQDF